MRVKLISGEAAAKLTVALLLFFVLLGDILLPEPLKSASSNTKAAMNSFILGFVPNKEFTNPNERTEKAVDEFEREAGGK